MDWIIEELGGLSLGDKRLDRRAQKILGHLSGHATDSIPTACRSAAEIKAAYRFFANDQVTPEKINQVHRECTLSRMETEAIVLIPQDTTVLHFNSQYERKDTGPTNQDFAKGMFLHCALAVTPEKVCLGMVSSQQWRREELQRLTRKERTQKNYELPIEEKESYRWLVNYRLAQEYAIRLPHTLIVSIADREGDLYDIYEEANQIFSNQQVHAHYLIRAKTDRRVSNEKGKKSKEKIKSTLQNELPLGEIDICVSETKKRKAREAHLEVYAKRMCIALPNKQKREAGYKPVEITAILCIETDPPAGAETIEWLLITDLKVNTFEEACEKIQWYTCRWQIEIFFKILKSGCMIEKLQLTDKNFSVCLSFYMIVAWRILYVVMLGRHCPDVSCECIFSQEEWQTTYIMVHRKKPPSRPPTLNEMTRMVASLGGYLNRKSDPSPGIKTMWIGFRNLQEHLKAKDAFEVVYGINCG